ncbi:MAG: hypothetical protein IK123_06345 [Lachnospiraceae bacterium]|nr:hypothetical protein [Lachnospiraceae bacterium]
MTKKAYLSQAYRIDQRIDCKLEQIASLRTLLTKTNVVMSDMPGNPNRDRSKIDEYLAKIIDMEREIDAEIDRLVSLKADIMHTINMVDDADCQMLLEKRYILFETWEKIADDMGYTLRNIYNLHGKALNMVNV